MFEAVLILLKMASLAATWLHERSLIDTGRKQQLAATLLEVSKSAGAAKEIRKQVEQLSDDDLDKELMS